MKKILAITLCGLLCLTTTACSAGSGQQQKVAEEAKKAAEAISTDIKSGEFIIYGKSYTFPMKASEFINDGWHISNNYENKDDFKVSPGAESNTFELFNDESENYIKMSVMNLSEEEAPIEECMVSYLRITSSEVDAVYPGGISKASKPADIEAAYGEPDSKETESDFVEYSYGLTNSEEYKCHVTIGVFDNDYTVYPCSHAEYYLTDVASNGVFATDYTGGMTTSETYQTYINSFLNASYHGDYTEYVQLGYAEEEGTQTYETVAGYMADALLYYISVDKTYVDQETYAQYVEFSKKVLAKTKWEFGSVTMTDTGSGTMEMNLYPLNLFEVIEEPLTGVLTTYQEKYGSVDKTTVSDEERTSMETECAKLSLEAMEGVLEQIDVKEAVNKMYFISDAQLSEDDWTEIDSILMGLDD